MCSRCVEVHHWRRTVFVGNRMPSQVCMFCRSIETMLLHFAKYYVVHCHVVELRAPLEGDLNSTKKYNPIGFCIINIWMLVRIKSAFGPRMILQPLVQTEVELDRTCQSWIAQMYPDDCVFGNIFDFMRGGDDLPTDHLLDPSKIKFNKRAWCVAHQKMCKIPNLTEALLVLGAPCKLFSRSPGWPSPD